jgi:hypothetical protein
MTVQKRTARYSVQNETARPLKNIQNGKIVDENEQHAWEQWGGWAIPILGKFPGSSAHDTVDMCSEPGSLRKREGVEGSEWRHLAGAENC